jgi:hypothetical protein
VNDLQITGADEAHSSRRPSRTSAGIGSNTDEMKSVRFASSSSPTTTSSRHKRGSAVLIGLTGGQSEDINTISSIQTLLQYVIYQEYKYMSKVFFIIVKMNNRILMKPLNPVHLLR